MIHKNIQNRRWLNHRAISKKKYICKHIYGFDWYKFDHQYSKNKIHCGCIICAYSKKLKLSSFKEMKDNEYVKNVIEEEIKNGLLYSI